MAFRKELGDQQTDEASRPSPRRLTRDLLRALELATMFAHSRASEVVEVSDLLAGMYMDNWERLAKFWPEREAIEAAMRKLCQISPQRWQYWLKTYDAMRRTPEKRWLGLNFAPVFRLRDKKEIVVGRSFEFSEQLSAIFKAADAIAPFSDKTGDQLLPIVSSECLLLCIAKGPATQIGRKLLTTGLDIAALEKAARFPKRPPI